MDGMKDLALLLREIDDEGPISGVWLKQRLRAIRASLEPFAVARGRLEERCAIMEARAVAAEREVRRCHDALTDLRQTLTRVRAQAGGRL